MDRGASAAFLAELAKQKTQPFHLVELQLDSGTIYATDASRNIEFNGNTYPALAHFLEFSGIRETTELQVSQCTVALSGVDQTWIAAVLGEDYLDRRLVIYKGFISTTGSVLAAGYHDLAESSLASFARASIATYVDSNGLIRTAAVDESRFDYDPVTGELLGLLVEGASTNSLSSSADLRESTEGNPVNFWSTTTTAQTANSGTAPDGTNSATKVAATGGSAAHTLTHSAVTTSAGATHTASIYVKPSEFDSCTFGYVSGGGFSFAKFTLTDAGSVGTPSNSTNWSGGSGTIEADVDGWYRITYTATNSGTDTRVRLYPRDNLVYDADGSGILAWGAQLEAGKSTASSYIPTTTAAVTRAADVAYPDSGASSVVVDPVSIFDGRCDEPTIIENPEDGKCTVALDAASHWVDFERRPGRHTNHEEQQIYFPGDTFFSRVSELGKPIIWGRGTGSAAAVPRAAKPEPQRFTTDGNNRGTGRYHRNDDL